jgi:autotransporter-associated beta strand protein
MKNCGVCVFHWVPICLGAAVMSAGAATFTWDGGGSDNYWQTAANWSADTAPASDGTASLAFAENTRAVNTNDFAADTVFAGLNLTNNKTNSLSSFTLAGNRIVLGGALTTTASSPGTLADTLALNLLLNAARTVTVNSAHNLTISGVIGETGGVQTFTKQGGGELTLSNTNTYSGKTTMNGGRVYFNSLKNIGEGPSSFGAPATAADGIIDINARMTYTGGAATSDRVLNFLDGYQFENNGSGTLTLNGGITGSGKTPTFRGNGTIVENGLIDLGSGGVSRTDGGTVFLNNSANAFTGPLTIMDGIISADALADAGLPSPIGAGNLINIGQANGTTGRLRYTGTNDASCNRAITIIAQPKNTNGGIIENASSNTTLRLSGNVGVDLWTNTPTLQLTGVGNGALSGVVSGAMRVTVNGSGTWALAGANTYTGVTTVSSGTLQINGSTAAGSAVTISSGAALGGTGTVYGAVSVSAGGRLAPGAGGVGTLTLANAGASALTLNGGSVTCEVSSVAGVCDTAALAGTLVLNGANTVSLGFPSGSAPAGTYTLMTYAAKSGSGTLALDHVYPNATLAVGSTAAVLTITGGGSATALTWVGDGSANAWDTTTANWSPFTYTDGNPVIFDDTGSASPAVTIAPAQVAPASVQINTSSKSYTFAGAGITGACGLVKSGTATFTLNSPNAYSGLTAVNAGTLILNGALSNSCLSVAWGATLTQGALGRIDGSTVSVTNYGTMTLAGTNAYGGTTVVGVLGISNITLNVNGPYALGSTAGGTIVNGGSGNIESRLMIGDGVTVTGETLTLNPASGNRAGLRFGSGGTGTWDGDVVIANVGGPAYIGNDGGGTFVIGGSDADTISGTSGNLSFRGGGAIVVNSRISLGSLGINRDDPGALVINSTGNTFSAINVVQGTLKLGVSDALPATVALTLGKFSAINNTAFLDLNGKSQRVASLIEQHQAGSTGTQRIISAAPATLVVSNDTANTFGMAGGSIEGAVSIVKLGNGTLTLTGTNTTSGSFIVSNGTLVVSSTGTLGNSTNVAVAAGTLTLQGSTCITNTATVAIANGGGAKVNVAAGVNETVSRLYFGDKPMRAATYGAPGSGAEVINDAHFSGSGVLTVLSGSGGLVIRLQ